MEDFEPKIDNWSIAICGAWEILMQQVLPLDKSIVLVYPKEGLTSCLFLTIFKSYSIKSIFWMLFQQTILLYTIYCILNDDINVLEGS